MKMSAIKHQKINKDKHLKTETKAQLKVKAQGKLNLLEKGTSRQRSGKGAIRKRFPLQKTKVEKQKQNNNQVLIP